MDNRLFRYLRDDEFLPAVDHTNDVVSLYDESKNLLLIRRDLFNALTMLQQHIVLKTTSVITRLRDLPEMTSEYA